MGNKNYALENPREIFTNFSGKEGSKVTLAVECHMNPAKVEDEYSPQAIFGKYSRIVFSMIRNGESVKSNVNFDELPDIQERTRFARTKVYERELNGAESAAEAGETLPIAYTTTFTTGPFKGRTPAEVVMEDPEGNREKLQEHYKFLRDNAEKYPRNKTIMDAITNAYELLEAGKLVKRQAAAQGKAFEIYKSGYRPQRNIKREDGLCKVQEMSILCNFGKNYPIELTITEYYAPVTSNNGRLNVQAAAIDQSSVKKVTSYMGMKEWNCLLSKLDDQKEMFIATYGPELLREADRIVAEKFQQRQKTEV